MDIPQCLSIHDLMDMCSLHFLAIMNSTVMNMCAAILS